MMWFVCPLSACVHFNPDRMSLLFFLSDFVIIKLASSFLSQCLYLHIWSIHIILIVILSICSGWVSLNRWSVKPTFVQNASLQKSFSWVHFSSTGLFSWRLFSSCESSFSLPPNFFMFVIFLCDDFAHPSVQDAAGRHGGVDLKTNDFFINSWLSFLTVS